MMESRRHTPSPYKNLDKKLTKFVFTREENISLPDVKKTNKSYSLLKDEGQASSIANLQKKIEFFLTEVEDRLDNIRKSPSPEVSLYKPSLDVSDISNKSYQFISETTHKHFSTTPTNRKSDFSPSPLKLLGKVRAKSIEKQEIQNKKSIVALMKSSNAFEKDQQIDKEIFNKLQKDLGNSKKPLIESLYTEIHNKETVYDAYKQYARGKSEYDKESPTSVYSKKCNDEHVPPIPIFTYIQDQSLILNRYNLNDNLCNVINESLYTLKNLRQIHLDECGITDQGGAYLLKGIATQGNIISFYYTRNEIGSKFADEFKKNSINFQFQEINLNRCRYTGSSLVETLRAINMCKHITKLFLSELGLSALAIDQICRCLRKTTLIELDLSWNKISFDGTKKFFNYVCKNKKLRYLDYSWNCLSSPDSELCIILSKIMTRHPSLLHINISHTKLDDNDVGIMINALKSSTVLIGLHLTGNQISRRMMNLMISHLNGKEVIGFKANSARDATNPMKKIENHSFRDNHSLKFNLKIRDSVGRALTSHRDNIFNVGNSTRDRDRYLGHNQTELILTRLLGQPDMKGASQWTLSSHCWICEKWVIHEFYIYKDRIKIIGSSNDFQGKGGDIAPLCLKASFNNWQEIAFETINDNEFELRLLLPPGKHYLWLIIDQNEYGISRQIAERKWDSSKVNEINIPLRNYELSVTEAEKEEIKRLFDKNKSVYRNFQDDNDQTRKIMFENDSKYYKLPRVIKSQKELQDVYDVLLNSYAELKEIFLYLSASSNYPSIGWLDFSDFCDQCEIIDKKFLNRAAVDRIFIAVNVELEELSDNPDRDLCRYEFYEILARIAMCKYQDLDIPPAQMTQKLIDEHVLKFAMSAKAAQFRKEKLYNLEVNDILEANLPNLQNLFMKYKERIGRWLTFKGIKLMVEKGKINIQENELIKVFAFSKMSILNEMDSDGAHFKLQFVEFLDFVGRLSDVVYNDDVPLSSKLDQVLDKLFEPNGIKKKPVNVESSDIDSDFSD